MGFSLCTQADDVTYTFTEGTPTDPFYFGSRVNDEDANFLDMILQADTDGWVAVGFSDTRDMVRLMFGQVIKFLVSVCMARVTHLMHHS